MGSSATSVVGIMPFSSAAEYTNGLNVEPGWRVAWVTWLNLLRENSKPPDSARIAPLFGLIAINAASTSGNWVNMGGWSFRFRIRTTAPRFNRLLAGARSLSQLSAGFKLTPLNFSGWPVPCDTMTSLGLADSTTALCRKP